MEERNSEGKGTFWAVLGVVAAGVAVVGAELLGAGLLEQWPVAVTVVGFVVSVAKMVGDYTKSRPAKHQALADREAVSKLEPSTAEAPADPSEG